MPVTGTRIMQIHSSDTVGHLKNEIAALEHVPVCQQVLYLVDDHTDELKNDRDIGSYGMKDAATLTLETRFNLYVQEEIEEYAVCARSFDTVEDIKSAIKSKRGVSSPLILRDIYGEELDERCVLAEQGIWLTTTIFASFEDATNAEALPLKRSRRR